MHNKHDLDPVFASDRNNGSTPPETGAQGTSVAGRPVGSEQAVGFHEGTETVAKERKPHSGEEALNEGGSFDGLGVPVADNTDR